MYKIVNNTTLYVNGKIFFFPRNVAHKHLKSVPEKYVRWQKTKILLPTRYYFMYSLCNKIQIFSANIYSKYVLSCFMLMDEIWWSFTHFFLIGLIWRKKPLKCLFSFGGSRTKMIKLHFDIIGWNWSKSSPLSQQT